MSQNSRVNTKVGPDFFGFYTSEVSELLSSDEGLLVGYQHHDVSKDKGLTKNSKTNESSCINGSSLFSNGIGALLCEHKKERLKSLLRQSVCTFAKEIDEMVDPVLSVCRIRSCLRCKENLLSLNTPTCKANQPHHLHKKLKRNCELENEAIMKSDITDDKECAKIDDDLRFLLESETTKVEELVKRQSNEFSVTLNHMEQKLEELVNILMTTCRSMTLAEKQQLRKSIQNLPQKNLDRVVEIIASNKPPLERCSSDDELHVDLDGMDNTTLWRLYFYVATIQSSTA